MTERTIPIPDEIDAQVKSVLHGRSYDDYTAEVMIPATF